MVSADVAHRDRDWNVESTRRKVVPKSGQSLVVAEACLGEEDLIDKRFVDSGFDVEDRVPHPATAESTNFLVGTRTGLNSSEQSRVQLCPYFGRYLAKHDTCRVSRIDSDQRTGAVSSLAQLGYDRQFAQQR